MTSPPDDAGATGQPVAVIARLLDLDPRRVQQLANEGVIPKAKRGRYPLVGAVQGYVRYLRDRANGQGNAETASDLNREKARLAKEQADHQAMVNAKLRGELAPAADLEFAVTALLSGVRTRIRGVGARLALDVAAESEPALCEQLINRAHDDALEAIADVRIEQLVESQATAEPAPGGREDHRERRRRDAPAAGRQRRRVERARTPDP